MLEIGAHIELEIIDVAYGGEFIARFGEAVVFVRGAVVGERVIAEITKKQAKLYRAIVREVIEASPMRITHPWPLGAVEATGAADYGHINLAGQRQMKSLMLQNQLRRIGGEEIVAHFSAEMFAVESVENGRDGSLSDVPSAQGWHYRTRIDVLKLDTGVGMNLARTNQLVQVANMPLASRKLAELDLFGSAWDKCVPAKKRIRLVAPNGSVPLAVIDDAIYSEPGVLASEKIHEIVEYRGEKFSYTLNAGSFWQIHENAPSALVSHVFDELNLSAGDKLVDLYSGSGLFSVVGAKIVGRKGELRAYEGDRSATAAAKRNLANSPWAKAQATNIDQKNVEKLIDGANVIIADPPRAGLGVETANIMANSKAHQVALVSCDSASMARDVSVFLKSGWRLESFKAIDIFPNTHYVETVVLMSKAD